MKVYKIPVTWEVYSLINVEAESLEEAIKIFDTKENSNKEYSLPTDSEYIDSSFKRDNDEICKLVNKHLNYEIQINKTKR